MVRVSNGEYIINADTVSRLGVPFFDRLNGMKNGGLMLDYNIPKYGDGDYLDSTMAYTFLQLNLIYQFLGHLISLR